MQFALVDRGVQPVAAEFGLELAVTNRDRLRIGAGVCALQRAVHKSSEGLHALVREHLELDPFAGHPVIFTSRQCDRIKILYWGVR
jgi:hypothetical protein